MSKTTLSSPNTIKYSSSYPMFLNIVRWLIFLKHIESAYHQTFFSKSGTLKGSLQTIRFRVVWGGPGRFGTRWRFRRYIGGFEEMDPRGSRGMYDTALGAPQPKFLVVIIIVEVGVEVQIGSGSSIVIASGACLRTRGSGGLGQAGASYRFAEVPKILRGRSHVPGILSFRRY